MEPDVAIRIEGLGKRYRLGEERPLARLLRPQLGDEQANQYWALLGSEAPPTLLLASSALTTTLLLASGLVVFRRLERLFADQV